MSDIAIKVEQLSKQYHIARKRKGDRSMKETLRDAFVAPFRKAGKLLRGDVTGASDFDETIWALKDISFEVKRGEVIGIIGRNGSGKSTLLKILSRITDPTEGWAEFYGRIGSLLEVGTGFQPELSGRDNIYLNGAILGMKHQEINRKFDEIVDFSEIEKFIDTPVKHYSSGMYMRLAFAVAAHLEPEILLIDEVLAVGDAAFQEKCLGKMGEVSRQGRTILFVSHNMAAIENLCQKALLLRNGILVKNGRTNEVIDSYLAHISTLPDTRLAQRKDRQGTGRIRIIDIELRDQNGNIIQYPVSGQKLTIRMRYAGAAGAAFNNCRVSCAITRNEQLYFNLDTWVVDTHPLSLSGEGYIDFLIPELPLSQSTYHLHSYIESNKEIQDWVSDAVEMSVVAGDFYKTGRTTIPGWEGRGLLVRYHWKNTAA